MGAVMKKIVVLCGVMLLAWSSAFAQFGVQGGVSVGFDMFYSSLSPHGEWIAVDRDVYGWRPVGVSADWRPYYYGRWAWTDVGWYWVSDEPWSWATYHYGRWYCDDYYGWIWIPGYEWAPAWVEWRYGGDYVGWAPLGPYAVFSFSFGIYYSRPWAAPYSYWCFVPWNCVTTYDVCNYAYRTEENRRLIGRTRSGGSVRLDGGQVVSRGPSRADVERRGNSRVGRTELVDVTERGQERVTRSGERERIEVYRPRIEESRRDGATIRPERVRMPERTISLDTRNIDMRSRSSAREVGRDLERAERYRREERRIQLPQDAERRITPDGRKSDDAPVRSGGQSWRRLNLEEMNRRVERRAERWKEADRGSAQPRTRDDVLRERPLQEPRQPSLEPRRQPPAADGWRQAPRQAPRSDAPQRSPAPMPRQQSPRGGGGGESRHR